MTYLTRFALSIALLMLLPISAVSALPKLPLAIPPEIAADTVLAQEMTALMQDYAQRLTRTRILSWLDFETFQTRSWSPHLDKFRAACRQQPEPCALLLRSQLKTLRDVLEAMMAAPRAERFGAALSVLTDLCAEPPWNGTLDTSIFNLCGGQAGMAGHTAIVWLELGYDELFLAYYATHEQKRLSTIAWLAEQPADDLVAKEQRQRLESNVSYLAQAEYYEAIDYPAQAAAAWMQPLLKALASKDYAPVPVIALNLERLSYQLGEVERGAQWHRVAEQIRVDHPELNAGSGCAFDNYRASAALAQAVALHAQVDTATEIKQLIKRDCGFTVLTIEYALASLRSMQAAKSTATLALAIKACAQSEKCSDSRVQHLQDLLIIAQGQEPELLKLSTRWLADSRIGKFNAIERQIVWALADALASSKGGHAVAQQLYVALDDQIQFERVGLIGMTPSTLSGLARYDALSRLRIKGTVQQGASIAIDSAESLRAQSLLRRLRIKRWQQEFAGIRDDAARAKLTAQLALLAQLRDVATKLSGSSPLEVALSAALLAVSQDEQANYQEQYLLELAARQAEAAGASPRKAWLGGGGIDILMHEQKRKEPGQNFSSLGAKEAYLSWLRVPGGYVGTLAVPDPMHTVQWDSHRLVSHFVPVSEAMASTLELYRKLLQSGAEDNHDRQFFTPAQAKDAGLVLQGVPVWRQPDGSFAATEQPSAGSVRAQSYSDLGDAIFKRLLQPFQADLKQVQHLVISPDGELAYLPFETLSNGGTPILDMFDIAYVQSLAVHEELSTRARAAKKSGPGLLTLADPDYTMVKGKVSSTRTIPRLLATANWPPLPGTRAESAALLKLYPGGQQKLGAQASRKQLDQLQRSGKLKQYRILHFATHGYVDDERSALVLSMGDGPDQGYLQDTDVLDLQLNTDLVLLSACDTGIGRNISGEGVMGLPYAFMLAGNSNTLMSLWPVDDAGTAAFMANFMAKVRKGDDLLAALNQTKREFARGDHGKTFTDPRIWAAFVQYGIGISVRQ